LEIFSLEHKVLYLEHHQLQSRVNEQGCSGPIKDSNRATELEQKTEQKAGSRPSSEVYVLQDNKAVEDDERKPLAYSSRS
jgi:hypothetical protein